MPPNPAHLMLLTSLQSPIQSPVVLSNLNCAEASIRHLVLISPVRDNLILNRVDFTNAHLECSIFYRVTFVHCQFVGINLLQTHFQDCEFHSTPMVNLTGNGVIHNCEFLNSQAHFPNTSVAFGDPTENLISSMNFTKSPVEKAGNRFEHLLEEDL